MQSTYILILWILKQLQEQDHVGKYKVFVCYCPGTDIKPFFYIWVAYVNIILAELFI